jgi:membrane fusion protein (multidrug efflux system)
MRPVLRSLLLAALILSVACSPPAEEPPASPAPGTPASGSSTRQIRVESVVLQPTGFEDVIQQTGAVEANDDATLSAQSGGTIDSLVPLGSRVAKGSVLARLDSELVLATLEQARAQLEVARAQYALADGLFGRQEPLYRDSIISDLEFDNVQSQRIQAQAEVSRTEATVRQVEKQLENTRITAPFGGTVEQHFVEEGEQVLPGSPVLRLVNTRRIRIAAGVPERYAGEVVAGNPVRVRFQAAGIEERTGTVGFASQVVDPDNRTFRVEVNLSNEDGRLKPAMIANLQITRARLEDRLVVPQTAVLRDENAQSVFVVTRTDGTARAERRTVTTGASFGGRVVIESGLEPGDEVIVVGQTIVTEGDEVIVEDASQAG